MRRYRESSLPPPRRRPSGAEGTLARQLRFRTSWLKSAFVVGGHRVGRYLPTPVLTFAFRRLVGCLRLSYWMPGNPLRRAGLDVTAVARTFGHELEPRAIHDRMLDQIATVGPRFIEVFYRGRERARDLFAFDPGDLERIRGLLREHGGAVLCVPHNVASVISALGLALAGIDIFVVVRNRKGAQHNAVAREAFERMGIDAMMVRDTTSMDVSRRCLRALSSGKLLIATLDYRYRKPNAISLPIFGLERGFAPWAVHFAAKRKVPILPCYPQVENGRVTAQVGEPLIDDDLTRLAEHYVRYFEAQIVRDPGSWAFLCDKHWRRHLRAARDAIERGQLRPVSA